jgi:hypothetical protein
MDLHTASAFVPPRLAEEVTMRHSVVNTRLLRQARATLDEEAARRPGRQAEPQPQPPQEAARGRLVALARRARALAVRAFAVRRLLRPRTEPR